MKRPKETFVYKNGEFVGRYECQAYAADATGVSPCVIGRITRGEAVSTKDGYHFSNKELTKEEMANLPIAGEKKEETKQRVRFNNQCKEFIENQEFEVDCKTRELFFFERSKEGKKAQLKQYIYSKLKFHFLTIPKKQAILEKRFIDTLINEI